MEIEKIFTPEKTEALCEKGLEENKISGSAQVITYAIKEAWIAGFEEGRKHQPERAV